MDDYTKNTPWGASALLERQRAVAPISGAQGTALPTSGHGVAFGFQPAGTAQLHTASTAGATPVMTIDVPLNDTGVDVRVPPRGRPL